MATNGEKKSQNFGPFCLDGKFSASTAYQSINRTVKKKLFWILAKTLGKKRE